MSHSDSDRTNVAELVAAAREIIDANLYLTLATADADGTPWASPVWYAQAGYREFLWVSRPDTRHSRNIASRSRLAIVIFDSTVPEGAAQAVYVEASAEQVPEPERAQAMETFSGKSVATGSPAWTVNDVTAPAEHRLYRATATAHYVLGVTDRRVPVPLADQYARE
jgi:nitroimidazol reductase NimA-like FMN-containing flavoprotein (pyridoxamine 5'-phosphate oxidase superfamily)